MPNNDTRSLLQAIINDSKPNLFSALFELKNPAAFREEITGLAQFNNDNFPKTQQLGKFNFSSTSVASISVLCSGQLNERAGKKLQYEQARKILKTTQDNAGIFIFYDQKGDFRFSLVYDIPVGNRRTWSSFKRFTYLVSKSLTNKTFLQRIGDGDFSSLETIKEAFSVEKVTKDFYTEIANWYFWAVRSVKFPKDAESDKNGRSVAVIRLITRLIFVWFMREKNLVPKNLFDTRYIANILSDVSKKESTYYKAILQNLFFATLNTPVKNRKFRDPKLNQKINKDFMDHSVYRYESLFKDPDKMLDNFKDIPFLNGGIFECLDRWEKFDGKNEYLRVDGFSDRDDNELLIPNQLFFADDFNVDLNTEYDTKNKSYKVRGLLNTLTSYNFTIDENTLDDAEVALDPELLGRIFENLLANFNPETATTARKATGSYYTPREIVEYMVSESLKEHFKSNLSDISDLEKKLEQLFNKDSDDSSFTPKEKDRIVSLIDNTRIIDPAVGSGAFPMGILNKLIYILSKIDPDNNLWKKTQIDAVDKNTPDPVVKRKLVEHIEKQFKEKNVSYGRKLYLIQKCIYGVDLQPIAVEIAKLRFFISLLVDENIDKAKENWGIEPLPNLDFKLMQGNSLISEFIDIDLDKEEKDDNSLLVFSSETDKIIKEFEQKKVEFQNESDGVKKTKLKAEINNLVIKMFETKLKEQRASYYKKIEAIESKYAVLPSKKQATEMIEKEKSALAKKEGFDLEKVEYQLREFTSTQKTKPFFAWKLYFAEVFNRDNPGFDIVIANPPYVNVEQIDSSIKDRISSFRTAHQKYDLYVLFYEKGIDILRSSGLLSYITSNKFLSQGYGLLLRQEFLKYTIQKIINFNYDVFNSATVRTCIFQLFKASADDNNVIETIEIDSENDLHKFQNKEYKLIRQGVFRDIEENNFRINLNDEKIYIIDKIRINTLKIEDICSVNYGLRPSSEKLDLKKESFIHDTNKNGKYKKYFEGKDMGYWTVKKTSFIDYSPNVMYNPMFVELFDNEKLVGLRTLSSINKLRFIYDHSGLYCNDSVVILILWHNLKKVEHQTIKRLISLKKITTSEQYSLKYLQAILNSKLIKFYVNELLYDGTHFYPDHMKSLPIKLADEKIQKPFINLVDKILPTTQNPDYYSNLAKQDMVLKHEEQIDQLIYGLYGLDDGEIKIIEDSIKH